MKRNFPSFASRNGDFTQSKFHSDRREVITQDRGSTFVKSSAKLIAALAALSLTLGLAQGAIADTPSSESPTDTAPEATSSQEVDSSVSRDYEPTVVYLPDPQTRQLVPQSVLVTAEEPVTGAVDQIMQSYEGQDIGIEDYEVNVDSSTHEAEINFEVDNPRGARAFESLSSSNQFVLFEAIRETLLTQPSYSIDEVIFLANGVSFDI